MGSLGSDTDISNIVYRNIYTWKSNQMYMIKSNGGSGSVSNAIFENFIGRYPDYLMNRLELTIQATETPTPSTSTATGAAWTKQAVTASSSKISPLITGKAPRRTAASAVRSKLNAPTSSPVQTSPSGTLPCGPSPATSRPTAAAAPMALVSVWNRTPMSRLRTAAWRRPHRRPRHTLRLACLTICPRRLGLSLPFRFPLSRPRFSPERRRTVPWRVQPAVRRLARRRPAHMWPGRPCLEQQLRILISMEKAVAWSREQRDGSHSAIITKNKNRALL